MAYNQSYWDNQRLVEHIVPGPIQEGLVYVTEQERRDITEMITKTLHVELEDIKKVKNSFLEAMYVLKKEEYKQKFPHVKEMLLVHITAASNVQSIISNNFDWRRVSRGKFGIGISFSPDAQYANKYANFKIGCKRAVIITKVIVCRTTNGRQNMVLPPEMWDTTVGNKGKVYVKFCDHEMLPVYVVTFYNTDSRLPVHSTPGFIPNHANRLGISFNNQNEIFIRDVYKVDREGHWTASAVNVCNNQRTIHNINQPATALSSDSIANQHTTALYRNVSANQPDTTLNSNSKVNQSTTALHSNLRANQSVTSCPSNSRAIQPASVIHSSSKDNQPATILHSNSRANQPPTTLHINSRATTPVTALHSNSRVTQPAIEPTTYLGSNSRAIQSANAHRNHQKQRSSTPVARGARRRDSGCCTLL